MQLYAGTDRRSEQGKGQVLEEETMAESLALYAMGSRSAMTSLKRLVEDYERRLILEALARARGNQRRAAAATRCSSSGNSPGTDFAIALKKTGKNTSTVLTTLVFMVFFAC